MTKEEAIKILMGYSHTPQERAALKEAFPELAESEDERIRRWLCDYFSSIDKAWIHKDITCIDILRWLEKQKEQKKEKFPPYVTGFKGHPDPAGTSDLEEAAKEYASKTLCDPDDGPSTGLAKESFIAGAKWQKEQKSAEWAELQSEFKNINEAFENGKKEVLTHPKKYGLCEQKPVDYDAELKKCKDNPLYFFDKYVSIKQKPVDNPKWNELTWKDINELERIINNVHYEFQNGIGEDSFGELVLERFREYKDDGSMDEQKPAEWDKEDKEMFEAVDESLYCYESGKAPEAVAQIEAERCWLSSLPERFNLQPKQEWSEEDEEILKLLILNIGRYKYFGGMSSERILAFLKSLRPSWKPNEEQMEALEECGECKRCIKNLYEQLKKL